VYIFPLATLTTILLTSLYDPLNRVIFARLDALSGHAAFGAP
jgi:hypothetical protein